DRGFLPAKSFRNLPGDLVGAPRTLQRGVGMETASRETRVAGALNDRLEHALDRTPRVRVAQLRHQRLRDPLAVMVEYRQEKSLLVAEGSVNAPPIYAGRGHQVADRGRLIAAFPEQRHRTIEHVGAIELLYTGHLRSFWEQSFIRN